MLMYKCLHGIAPNYLSDLIVPYKPTRSLRSSALNRVVQPGARTKNYGERRFSYQGPILWNLLPLEVKNADSVGSFKRKLKHYLFNQYYQP